MATEVTVGSGGQPPAAILIAGPTASGKSALALALARRHGGAIINADSMQVYSALRVLTARPSVEDEAQVPHLLYGHVDPAEAYSAGRFVREATAAIAAVRAAGRVPILVGGSGLYFKALLEGLSPIPEVAASVRAYWRSEAERLGPAGLHAVLSQRDPLMAGRLSPTDPQRITRALEVLESSGRSLAHWQSLPGVPALSEALTVRYVVAPPRDELYRRCDARFDAMMSRGALDEVSGLARRDLDLELPVMRALGVRPLMQLLTGAVSLDDAVAAGKADTRQYAKRQVTWLNGHMMTWNWLSEQEYYEMARSA